MTKIARQVELYNLAFALIFALAKIEGISSNPVRAGNTLNALG
jgi:hypothetical protein